MKFLSTSIKRVQTLVRQFKSYVGSIAALINDMFRFKPGLMIKLLVLAGLGTTLQAFSLGSTFFILRHMEGSLQVDLGRLLPVEIVDATVHATLLLAAVLAILSVAVFILYKAERAAFDLSSSYANYCGADLIDRFPLIAGRFDNQSVHPKTGQPAALISELRTRTGKLEIGTRTLLMTPTAFLQTIYGSIFLFVLEPCLTLLLLVVMTPLLVPLNRMTLGVRDAEKKRVQASARQRGEVGQLTERLGRLPVPFSLARAKIGNIFQTTGFAGSNYHRRDRLISQAGSKAVATSALTLTGMVSMLYLWLIYSEQGLPVALIVTYFGALRLAVMSSKQIVSRMAAFARFYEEVLKLLSDKGQTVDYSDFPAHLGRFVLAGPDLTDYSRPTVSVKAKGLLAVVGTFPLLPVNRYLMAGLLPNIRLRWKKAMIYSMAVVPEDPDLGLDLSWSEFLGLGPVEDMAKARESLRRCCYFLDPEKILAHKDQGLMSFMDIDSWSDKKAVEAVLIRAFFMAGPVVAVRQKALELLGHQAVEHWKRLLDDHLLLVYYKYDRQTLGTWGERYVGLIGSQAGDALGLVPVDWANDHRDQVMEELKKGGLEETGSEEELDWDDEDDE